MEKEVKETTVKEPTKTPSLYERLKNFLKKKPTKTREVIWGGQKYNINF